MAVAYNRHLPIIGNHILILIIGYFLQIGIACIFQPNNNLNFKINIIIFSFEAAEINSYIHYILC